MKKELISTLTKTFEDYAYVKEGVEYWFARDLQELLGYTKWENFKLVIEKAKEACNNSGQDIQDHFPEVRKTIAMPKGATKEIEDFMLTRYACYLIAQNGDPRKEEIAFAQSYFAIQTRKQELIERRITLQERFEARNKLIASETELSQLIYERGVDEKGFARIRSKGDEALFGGINTLQMKEKLRIPKNRPIAYFLPTVTITAKSLATEMTNFNVKKENFEGGVRLLVNTSKTIQKYVVFLLKVVLFQKNCRQRKIFKRFKDELRMMSEKFSIIPVRNIKRG